MVDEAGLKGVIVLVKARKQAEEVCQTPDLKGGGGPGSRPPKDWTQLRRQERRNGLLRLVLLGVAAWMDLA